jgi:hypothetical protein
MSTSFSQWQQSGAYPGGDAPFRAAEIAGPQPFFHDPLDAMRSMHRRTPDSEFPDGYLGTIQTKRADRLRAGLQQRQDNKPYSRGVHKGERLDGRDYFWPPEMQPTDGIAAQLQGRKYVPPGVLMEAGITPTRQMAQPNDASLARVGARGVPGARNGMVQWEQTEDPERLDQLRKLAPPWSRGPGMGVGTAYPGRA